MVELRYLVGNLWLGSSSDACRNIAHLRKGIMFDDVKASGGVIYFRLSLFLVNLPFVDNVRRITKLGG